MSWLLDPFRPEFMQHALLAGLLTALATSLIGVWVVIRGMSFIGDALAHGVVPGLALATVVGFDPTLGVLLSAGVMILAVTGLTSRARLAEDTSIGLLFVGMLATGVMIISRSSSYSGDLTAFLFGSPFSVTDRDLVTQGVVTVTVVAGSLLGYRVFLALSFNRQKALVLGMRPGFAHGIMLALVALAIVGSFRSVGALLVFGLLIGPPATASLVARRVPVMMALSVALGAFAVVVGLIVGYHAETAGGATIAVTAVATFFVVLAGRETLTAWRSARPSVDGALDATV